ncbi:MULTISPECIES: hypothetical protein [Flammeovirga]|uniref:Phage shock protein B n=1 Tax=Flammeovirga agarivorans TaxID=2726742 RepID=A0A7X8SGQ5_9BACT|nr:MULTISPECIES: hypothetical protein [Flammeovirga]NLR89901.1 hypothetical protein [Flammeovirga agarivorans]
MDPLLIPLMAIAMPAVIVAIVTRGKKYNNKFTKQMSQELESLKKENERLRNRIENIETIVTEPDWDIKRTLDSGESSKQKHLE